MSWARSTSDDGASLEAESCSAVPDTTSTASFDMSEDAPAMKTMWCFATSGAWELSAAGSAVDTPRGHCDDKEGNTAAWSRMRTPSPEGRYTSSISPGAGPCQFTPPHFVMQQWPSPYQEVTQWCPLPLDVQAVAAPVPPPRPLPLDELVRPRRDRPRRGDRGADARAQRRRSADASGQAPAGMPVLSVGSVGHPSSCGPPCKYSRKGHACKDGADCSHCHACVWKRSDERRAQAWRTDSLKPPAV